MTRNVLVALVTSGAVALAFPTSSLAQNRGRAATGRAAATAGDGQARGRADGGSGRRAAPPSAPAGDSGARRTARPRDGSGNSRPSGDARGTGSANRPDGASGTPSGPPPEGQTSTKTAVGRRPDSGQGGGRTVIVTRRGHTGVGFYPWGYGGLGLGGYYGGIYDPWWSGDYPYWESEYGYASEGSLRIKVKPQDASVYVDGYFAGRVDDFDGLFQSLRMEPGPHRIEVRQDGFEPLMFDVRIQPDRRVTYSGAMTRLP